MSQDISLKMVSMAMDALMLRQTAIAHNISNANSTNATAMRVAFENQLQKTQFNQSENYFTPEVIDSKMPIELDKELALSLQNTTQFRALTKGINHKLAIMQLAMKGS